MLTQIGSIKSVHGVKGDIVIAHSIPEDFNMELIEAFMIEINPKSYIPYFIKEINEISTGELLVTFEEITNREEAITLLNKNVYAPPTLSIEINSGNEWTHLIGFMLFDDALTQIGIIEDVYINGHQVLLALTIENNEILIPISDELIVEKNDALQTLRLEIAEGLLDL